MRDDDDAPQAQGSGGPPRWNTTEERWAAVELNIQMAIRRGEFDDLPGAGKPIEGLGQPNDPDWWIRRKIENENLTGLAPPAFLLRTEDEDLPATLDEMSREADVREHLEEFNKRVRHARMQLMGGPPVVTRLRDVEEEVAAWRARRTASASSTSAGPDAGPDARPDARPKRPTRRPWWRRS